MFRRMQRFVGAHLSGMRLCRVNGDDEDFRRSLIVRDENERFFSGALERDLHNSSLWGGLEVARNRKTEVEWDVESFLLLTSETYVSRRFWRTLKLNPIIWVKGLHVYIRFGTLKIDRTRETI
jgi:hypothetical protein